MYSDQLYNFIAKKVKIESTCMIEMLCIVIQILCIIYAFVALGPYDITIQDITGVSFLEILVYDRYTDTDNINHH